MRIHFKTCAFIIVYIIQKEILSSESKNVPEAEIVAGHIGVIGGKAVLADGSPLPVVLDLEPTYVTVRSADESDTCTI